MNTQSWSDSAVSQSAEPCSGKNKGRLGDRLIAAGIITEEQLSLALREHKRLDIFLGEALTGLGFLTQHVLSAYLAEETSAEVVDVKNIVVSPELISLLPYDLAKRHKVLPLHRENGRLTIAMSDTLNIIGLDSVELATGLSVDVVAASEQDILDSIEINYAQGASIEETMDQILNKGLDTVGEEAGDEAPMIRLVDQIIAIAINRGATDIHVEPDEKILRVRMRVDGFLQQAVLMPKPLQAGVTARLKIMSGMNVTEKRVPQDGRITFSLGLRQIDLRISSLPTNFGESIVIRILDKDSMRFNLEDLGMTAENREMFDPIIHMPHGIVLVTGPTGSGKTSTLYAALGMVNAKEKSVFTLEDPVEYQLSLIRQTQVRANVGMTFAKGLRSLLRQDPDIIMVGEIRDGETAELAVRAALTGHLVFSTLHTNDAIGAIPRLVDMGIEPYLISSALEAVMAQRLVRRICDHCKEEDKNPERILEGLNIDIPSDVPVKLWKGKGCESCSGTGYRGRQAIFEVLRVTEDFHEAITGSATIGELRKIAMERGMRTMFDDGIIKAFDGVTTIDEVVRVVK